MEKDKITELVNRYNDGLATTPDVVQLEKLLEAGLLEPGDLHTLSRFDEKLTNMETPLPSVELDRKFYDMLSAEKRNKKRFTVSLKMPSLSFLFPRLAFAAVLLIAGFAGGYWLNRPAPAGDQVAALSKQVDNLQEMVMLSLLEKESASERLRAVSLTSEMDQASKKVTTALLQTLNQDDNVNVRLAALDALRPYVKDNTVRTALVKSISTQDSPLVQIAMAELMRDILEKKSVGEFYKILKGDKIPEDVKKTIKERIQVLI